MITDTNTYTLNIFSVCCCKLQFPHCDTSGIISILMKSVFTIFKKINISSESSIKSVLIAIHSQNMYKVISDKTLVENVSYGKIYCNVSYQLKG